jgi:plastocyanin
MTSLEKVVVAVATALVLLTSACGGEQTPGGGATAAPPESSTGGPATAPCEPSGTKLQVVAEGIAFDKGCLAAPSGQPFTIEFTNNDAGIPHNVAIHTDESASDALFVGEIFQGVETKTYDVPSLEPGTYFFHCDVHPTQMTGTFVVG